MPFMVTFIFQARIFLEKVQVSGGEQWFNLLVTALQESVTLGNTELGDLLQKDYDTELSRKHLLLCPGPISPLGCVGIALFMEDCDNHFD